MAKKAKRTKAKAATRTRRSPEEMAALRAALVELVYEHAPVSVRQAFYLAVSKGLVEKTEGEYKRTVVRLLADAREDGMLPWDTIVDHTRTVHRPYTYDGLVDAVEDTRRTYRRALWRNQPNRVELWCEKRTLLGVLDPVSDEWDLPLYPCNGYPSRTFLHVASRFIARAAAHGKPTHLLYLGDHDPSGKDIDDNVLKGLRRYAPGADISLERLAVTEAQIEALGLPTRPTKTTDSRSKNFKGPSTEVEAVPPGRLRALVERAVEARVDAHQMAVVRAAEEDERKLLGGLAALAAKRSFMERVMGQGP